MDLIENTNKRCNFEIIKFDKVVFGSDEENKHPIIVIMVLNNMFARKIKDDKNTYAAFSLYNTKMSDIVKPGEQGLHTVCCRNYYDATNLYKEFVSQTESASCLDMWKFIKERTYIGDIFRPLTLENQEAIKEDSKNEPICYVTESTTHRLLVARYFNKPVIVRTEDGIRVLGVLVQEKVGEEKHIYSKDEEAMVRHLIGTFFAATQQQQQQ